jgi:cytochrome P450
MLDPSILYSPFFWSDPIQAHKQFAEMRCDAPIYRCSSKAYPDLWHVTRYADLTAIENAADVFLSAPRMTINTLAREAAIREATGGRPYMIKPLNAMDAPEHQQMRSVVQQYFTPTKIKQLKSRIDQEANNSISTIREINSCCDFASQIAFEYPLRVIMPMLGIPKRDYQLLFRLTKQLFSPGDPDYKRINVDLKEDPARDMKEIHKEFHSYFSNLLNQKRKHPSTDLITEIAHAMPNNKYMDQDNAVHYCILLATAGHDTTSYSLSEAMYQISLNSSLLTSLSEDPEHVASRLTEEAVRLAAPTRHFIRTANQDVTISGTKIHSGDSIILWFPSACRDEMIYPDPDILKIDRTYKVAQPAFGSGPHVCLGMHLARLELTCFLQEFGKQARSVDLIESPRYTESNFVGGIKSLPIRLKWR